MNLAVPVAPQGPRAPQGSGEAAHPHAKDKAAEQDFAAALAETASEQGDEVAGDGDIAKPAKVSRIQARLPHRFESKDNRGTVEGTVNASGGEAKEVETNKIEIVRPSADELTAATNSGASMSAAGAPATDPSAAPAIAPGFATAMRDAIAARDVQGVRDLLIALTPDAPMQPEKAATLDDLMTRLDKHLPQAARAAISLAGEAVLAEEGPSNLELFADISDEVLASAKVVRQETHFQPVGQDVRRLPSMTPLANDDRLMEMSLAAATRTGRQAAGGSERQDTPTFVGRAVETMATATSAVSGDQPLPVSVGQQIADGVQRALAEPAPSDASPTTRAPAEPSSTLSTTFAPALRTIKLQLNPASLGTVTVLLSGRDSELSITLEAELAETVGKVEQDRGVLTARLAGAGYGVNEITVGRMGASASGAEADQRDSGARAGSQPQDDGGRGRSNEGGASSFNEDRAGGRFGRQPQAEGATLASRGRDIEHSVAGISYAGRFRPV